MIPNKNEILQKIEECLAKNDLLSLKNWLEDQLIEIYLLKEIAFEVDMLVTEIEHRPKEDAFYIKAIDMLKTIIYALKEYSSPKQAYLYLRSKDIIWS